MPLSRVLASRGDALLEELYAPLPTTLTLTAEVREGRLARWALCVRDGAAPEAGEAPPRLWPLDEAPSAAIFDVARIRAESAIGRGDLENLGIAGEASITAPASQDGIKWNLLSISVPEVVAALDHTVVLGPPGSGKTIAARHLVLSVLGPRISPPLAHSMLADTTSWPRPPEVPIYVELRELVEWKGFPAADEDATEEDLWRYLQGNHFPTGSSDSARAVARALASGEALLVIDGLDEVPAEPAPEDERSRREQIRKFISKLVSAYRGCRIVVTSRQAGYTGWELDGFTPVTLAALDDRRLVALGERLWQVARPQKPDGDVWARAWLKELQKLPNDLYDRPLFATLMAALMLKSEEDQLPASRGDLYRESIMLLLERWAQSKGRRQSIVKELECEIEDLYSQLAHLAYDVFEQGPQAGRSALRIELGLLLKHLYLINRRVNPRRVLAYLEKEAGVLVSPQREEYEFAHRGFQEYLAAVCLTMPRDPSAIVSDLRAKLAARPDMWREPAFLVADTLLQDGRQTDLWEAASVALGGPGASRDSDEEALAEAWSAWMAARWLEKILRPQPASRPRADVLEAACIRLGDILGSDSPLPGLPRAEIGATLGVIGDRRAGVGVVDGIPEIEWCRIQGGSSLLGLEEDEVALLRQKFPWAAEWSFERETPAYRFEAAPFAIGRYPITAAQFECFVADPQGYENPQWWTESGWDWRTHRGDGAPADSEWGDAPSLPRTNLSWYEAVAFCAWLTEKLGVRVRLPCDPEWELAARGPERRVFPWGEEFDPARCNGASTGIGSVCVVGCFGRGGQWPDGGATDMSGNIWEWCSTIFEIEGAREFRHPYDASDGREDRSSGEEALRVLRGGAYLSNALNLMTTFRGRDQPSRQYARQGFRVVADDGIVD